jgi:hypothetical protein
MIVLVPGPNATIDAVIADRVVVRREKTKLRLWFEFGGSIDDYVLEAKEEDVRHAWDEFVRHCADPSYVWDLTWMRDAPAPEAVATGD